MTGSWPTGLDVVWADIRGHARFPMDEASELKQVDEGTGFLDVSGCHALCERDKSCLGFAAVGGEAHDHGLVPICQTFTSDDSDHPSDLTMGPGHPRFARFRLCCSESYRAIHHR